jgi:hypothetical protein
MIFTDRFTALLAEQDDGDPESPGHIQQGALLRLPVEVWLEEAGLTRRIAVNYESAAGADRQVWAVVELWDFGLAVDIMLPCPEEVLVPREAYRLTAEEPPGQES